MGQIVQVEPKHFVAAVHTSVVAHTSAAVRMSAVVRMLAAVRMLVEAVVAELPPWVWAPAA